jgi:hypothetical protein
MNNEMTHDLKKKQKLKNISNTSNLKKEQEMKNISISSDLKKEKKKNKKHFEHVEV